MKEESKKEKLTVKTAVDDVIGGALVGTGVVGASVVMKVASAKFNLNPWLTPAIALALGIGGRIGANLVSNKNVKDGIKDVSSGFVAAAALDLAYKGLKKFDLLAKLPDELQTSIPQLSGGDRAQVISVPGFYGASDALRGDFQEANVMSSRLLS